MVVGHEMALAVSGTATDCQTPPRHTTTAAVSFRVATQKVASAHETEVSPR